ncbi:MAG: hypothetical protein FJ190_08130 [Gammaproteobacteria bacterium]|nr:hypothetical protein [Gammaproteobacteria bacterium]
MNNAQLTKLATAISMLLVGGSALAVDVRFQDFTPLAASAGPTLDEAFPITLSNPVLSKNRLLNVPPNWAKAMQTQAFGT